MLKSNATTVDEYLEQLPRRDFREELQRIRAIALDEVPEATEVMSYDMPTFKLGAKSFLHMAAFKSHCSIFGSTVGFEDELSEFKTSGRGTIQFTAKKPLPEDLLRRIIRARISHL